MGAKEEHIVFCLEKMENVYRPIGQLVRKVEKDILNRSNRSTEEYYSFNIPPYTSWVHIEGDDN